MTVEEHENDASSYEEITIDPDYAIEKEECEPLPEDPAVYRRAANEDDDGYDPWSDRTEEAQQFEEDPWR